ncbi:hypothetical protein CA13_28740 [Planctomycetes bacterium CA13]|uniref:Uncharacterized protein n=1 Tax=Novipirellula herctigrandis TaxID=2527986 RepID=A0A5C5Z3I7_9BACT|nr:hypothetical protein CA13_28740 [Planctomycetes bacterium CA13]
MRTSKSLFENTLPLAGGSDAVAAGEGAFGSKRRSIDNTALPARSSRPSRRALVSTQVRKGLRRQSRSLKNLN